MTATMWTSMASPGLPAPCMGGRFSGGDPQMQQQAPSQAQISSLQQQNALLNQQLATQAASHIHQLQQFLHPSSSSPNPQIPAPSEPPQPKVQSEVKTSNSLPINIEEMVRRLEATSRRTWWTLSRENSRRASTSTPSDTTSSYHFVTTTKHYGRHLASHNLPTFQDHLSQIVVLPHHASPRQGPPPWG